MKKIILTLLLILSLFSYSQTSFNSENFKVTRNDLKINTYDKDSTANALVLYEYGNSYFHKFSYALKAEEKHKVKILNREGFNKATIKIYLYATSNETKETIKDIIATTYNLIDGKIVATKLLKANIFQEKYNENYTILKFTLPNIKEGSVITYSYTVSSPFTYKFKGWKFQDDIPKLYSEYNTSIPGNYDYNIKLVGLEKLVVREQKIKPKCLSAYNGAYADCVNNIYAMKNIPAFIEEDYMTSKSNYLARIEYELKTFKGYDGGKDDYAKTWKTVDKELKKDGDIGKQLAKSIKPTAYLSNTILNEPDKLKKAKAIYKYVQENYTWNEEYKIFKDVSIKDLIKNKSGNVSSINILLHNLLKASGIKVKPILLSTRSNGFATKIYPVISDFNYLINQVNINKKLYLLDATGKYLPFGEIPFKCLNGYGRLLDFKDGSYWVDIFPSTLSTVQYKIELNIDNDDEAISGIINSKTTGYHALSSKKKYYPNPDSYVDNLQNKHTNFEIIEHKVTSKNKTSSDFTEVYNIEFTDDLETGNIYLNPFIIKFFKENPFKLQDRTYPIDFGYKDTYYYVLKLNFGDAFTILEKPKDVNFMLPNKKGQIIFSTQIKNNALNILLKISFKESIYPIEYYSYLKKFMSKIIDIQNNSLILLKKN